MSEQPGRQNTGTMARMGFPHLSNPLPHGINSHEVINRVRFPDSATWDWHNSPVTEEWRPILGGCGHPAQTFLHFMSLRTGVEMISLSMLFNRVAGFYGLLAILTGFRLDATQLSMYLYSVVALVLLALLMPHIRKQSPLECLALAWFYALDTVLNCVYTAAFAVTWFLTVRASDSGTQTGAPGSWTMNDTAGFMSPMYNVSEVDVVASLSADLASGQDAVAIGKAAIATAITAGTTFQHVPSIVIIVLLTLIRFYFVLIVMAYARQILRQYLQAASSARSHIINDGSSDLEVENPFAPNMPVGQGWRGKLGRTMLFIGRGYFLDGPVDDDWAKGVNSRFKPSKVPVLDAQRGTFERERRARSGTGPPLPPLNLKKLEV